MAKKWSWQNSGLGPAEEVRARATPGTCGDVTLDGGLNFF